MKSIATILGLMASSGAFAADLKVDLTTFSYAGQRTQAAEVCGKVTGIASPFVVVKVTVDDKSEKPGVYNVLVGSDGSFCSAVVSYRGTAVASVSHLGKEVFSNSLIAGSDSR